MAESKAPQKRKPAAKAPAKPATKAPAKAPAAKAATPAVAKKPQDRQVSKAEQSRNEKRQREMVSEMLATGVDFDPFLIDVGDGREWGFTPDPMPVETENLSKALTALGEASAAREGLVEAFDTLTELVRDRLMDEADKEEFPLPIYGMNAISFFALHLATGRDGLPTEEA